MADFGLSGWHDDAFAVGERALTMDVLVFPTKAPVLVLGTWKQMAHAGEGADMKTSKPIFMQLIAEVVLFNKSPPAVTRRVQCVHRLIS